MSYGYYNSGSGANLGGTKEVHQMGGIRRRGTSRFEKMGLGSTKAEEIPGKRRVWTMISRLRKEEGKLFENKENQ